MKFVFALLALSFFAKADQAPTVDPVRGHWVIESRICSSGVSAHDGFEVGRDEMTMSFIDGKYDTHSKVRNCHYWATGEYTVQGNMLRVFDVVGASNCSNQPPAREGTVIFSSVDAKLKIITGPFGPGGSCPGRDLLETTFKVL